MTYERSRSLARYLNTWSVRFLLFIGIVSEGRNLNVIEWQMAMTHPVVLSFAAPPPPHRSSVLDEVNLPINHPWCCLPYHQSASSATVIIVRASTISKA